METEGPVEPAPPSPEEREPAGDQGGEGFVGAETEEIVERPPRGRRSVEQP